MKVIVTDDKGGVAVGMKREWFSVIEKKSQLSVSGLEMLDEPASVVILLDFSNSVPSSSKRASLQAAVHFVKTANPKNDYLILAVYNEVTVIADWGRDQQRIEKALVEATQRTVKDGTALYDACNLALTSLPLRDYPTHVLLIFSDGLDNASKQTFIKLHDQIKNSSATLYAVGLQTLENFTTRTVPIEGQGILDELTSVSGGYAYYPENRKMMLAAIDQISLELRHQYRIRFRPTSLTPDSKWHSVKVGVSPPEKDEKGRKFPRLHIRSRSGYYDR